MAPLMLWSLPSSLERMRSRSRMTDGCDGLALDLDRPSALRRDLLAHLLPMSVAASHARVVLEVTVLSLVTVVDMRIVEGLGTLPSRMSGASRGGVLAPVTVMGYPSCLLRMRAVGDGEVVLHCWDSSCRTRLQVVFGMEIDFSGLVSSKVSCSTRRRLGGIGLQAIHRAPAAEGRHLLGVVDGR